jgi:hypothetical protein
MESVDVSGVEGGVFRVSCLFRINDWEDHPKKSS